MILIDYEKTPEGKAEWDARQMHVRRLENLNTIADSLKMQIELRQGKPSEVAWYYQSYFSVIKQLYRNIRYHYSDKKRDGKPSERESVDKTVRQITEMISMIRCKDNSGLLIIPKGLGDTLETFHMAVNQKRFEVGLVIPIKTPERFDMFEGYDQSD